MAFRITSSISPSAPAPRQTVRVPGSPPLRRDASVNGAREDRAPDHEPLIPWPAAPGTTHRPFR